MRDGISDDAIDAGRDVDLLDAINVAQLLGGDLAGRGFLARLTAEPKVKTLPARTPSTRLIIPCSPMHMPTSECRSPSRARNLIMVTLSASVVAVLTTL